MRNRQALFLQWEFQKLLYQGMTRREAAEHIADSLDNNYEPETVLRYMARVKKPQIYPESPMSVPGPYSDF